MTDINIFAPPPDATLDRIVAANRPRVMARVHRHWWQRFTATKSFTVMSGLSIFAAGALVSAAVLVPQLRPGEATFTVHCYDSVNSQVSHFIWGGANAPANTATRAQAQADPASTCIVSLQVRNGLTVIGPIVQTLISSGHLCGNVIAQTGQVYPFQADKDNPQDFNIEPPLAGSVGVTKLPGCPDFSEPVSIPPVGSLVACRASATSAAVYAAGDDTEYSVCSQHHQPIWTGEGR